VSATDTSSVAGYLTMPDLTSTEAGLISTAVKILWRLLDEGVDRQSTFIDDTEALQSFVDARARAGMDAEENRVRIAMLSHLGVRRPDGVFVCPPVTGREVAFMVAALQSYRAALAALTMYGGLSPAMALVDALLQRIYDAVGTQVIDSLGVPASGVAK
jgi:hypothetical protein